jgi:hypothetical protein
MAARNVREIVEACKRHREYCPLCNAAKGKETPRKGPSSSEGRRIERKAA